MNILVTGGAGFIGSALCRHLAADPGHRVVNVDKLTYAGNLASLRQIENYPNYRFVKADICDAAAMARILSEHDVDIVMHLAAESHVDRSIDGPAEFIETNIVGTFRLLSAALAHWQRLPADRRSTFRFHHVSTDEVFGDLPFDSGITDRPGHDRRYAIDASKIERELGWTPSETFESGLAGTVRWYLDNSWWWEPIRSGRYAGERLGASGQAAS